MTEQPTEGVFVPKNDDDLNKQQKIWAERERAMGRAAAEVDRKYGIHQDFNHSHITIYFMEGYQGG